MKKIVILLVAAVSLASCSLNKSFVNYEQIGSDIKSYTAATLQVSDNVINYTYLPTKIEGKTLSREQLIQNAIFDALQNKGYDTMVQIRYRLYIKRGWGGFQVTRVDLSGFPANYVGFRDPTDADRENAIAYDGKSIVSPAAATAGLLKIFSK